MFLQSESLAIAVYTLNHQLELLNVNLIEGKFEVLLKNSDRSDMETASEIIIFLVIHFNVDCSINKTMPWE